MKDQKQNKALVIGMQSFLGARLVPALEKDGYTVTGTNSKSIDLRDAAALPKADLPKFDVIFHLAAYTRAGDFCDKFPGDQWVINQQINTHVVTWWKTEQPQAKLIAMGSSACYDPALPLREDYYLQGMPHEKYLAYAMSKRMLYTGQLAMHKQFGLKYLHLIPSTIFGPDYHTDGRQLHFVYDIIRKILIGQRKNEKVLLWGDGHQRRELIFIDDIVTDIVHLTRACEDKAINLSSGKDFSIRELVTILCAIVDFPESGVEYDPKGFVGAPNKHLDISALTALFPTRKQTDLTTALRTTVAWVKEHLF